MGIGPILRMTSFLLLFFFFLAGGSSGQSTLATLEGKITDPEGNALAGAAVSARVRRPGI